MHAETLREGDRSKLPFAGYSARQSRVAALAGLPKRLAKADCLRRPAACAGCVGSLISLGDAGDAGRDANPESQIPNPELKFAGGHRSRVTPVPIPNTEVKPATADGTAWETVWESRSLPALFVRPDRESGRAFFFSCAATYGRERAPRAGGGAPRAVRNAATGNHLKARLQK